MSQSLLGSERDLFLKQVKSLKAVWTSELSRDRKVRATMSPNLEAIRLLTDTLVPSAESRTPAFDRLPAVCSVQGQLCSLL